MRSTMKGQLTVREETFRRSFLVGAGLCWLASIVLVVLLVAGTIDVRTGYTSVVVLLQSIAVTLTIVWAQFRVRKIMTAVLKAGMQIDGLVSKTKEGER